MRDAAGQYLAGDAIQACSAIPRRLMFIGELERHLRRPPELPRAEPVPGASAQSRGGSRPSVCPQTRCAWAADWPHVDHTASLQRDLASGLSAAFIQASGEPQNLVAAAVEGRKQRRLVRIHAGIEVHLRCIVDYKDNLACIVVTRKAHTMSGRIVDTIWIGKIERHNTPSHRATDGRRIATC